MTEVREPNFGVDLPGQWEQVENAEPGTYAYRQTEGGDTLTVTLLAVRSMYSIADPKRLLDDYLHHRSTFEQGRDPGLEQSEPVSLECDDSFEGTWDGTEVASGRRVSHRVVLTGGLLADFRFEAAGLVKGEPDNRGDAVLASVTVSAS